MATKAFKRATGVAGALQNKLNNDWRNMVRRYGPKFIPSPKDMYIAYPNGKACATAGKTFESEFLQGLEHDDVQCHFFPGIGWKCWAIKTDRLMVIYADDYVTVWQIGAKKVATNIPLNSGGNAVFPVHKNDISDWITEQNTDPNELTELSTSLYSYTAINPDWTIIQDYETEEEEYPIPNPPGGVTYYTHDTYCEKSRTSVPKPCGETGTWNDYYYESTVDTNEHWALIGGSYCIVHTSTWTFEDDSGSTNYCHPENMDEPPATDLIALFNRHEISQLNEANYQGANIDLSLSHNYTYRLWGPLGDQGEVVLSNLTGTAQGDGSTWSSGSWSGCACVQPSYYGTAMTGQGVKEYHYYLYNKKPTPPPEKKNVENCIVMFEGIAYQPSEYHTISTDACKAYQFVGVRQFVTRAKIILTNTDTYDPTVCLLPEALDLTLAAAINTLIGKAMDVDLGAIADGYGVSDVTLKFKLASKPL